MGIGYISGYSVSLRKNRWNEGYVINNNGYKCLIASSHYHSEEKHSVIFIHSNSISFKCWSHGTIEIKQEYVNIVWDILTKWYNKE